ncbi:MAG TPA: F0F1 ATP synthase subunit A [Chloroflexota bacterium]|nr:F0F1 ATP synthase subunit A [Chloroflexota bacterium]
MLFSVQAVEEQAHGPTPTAEIFFHFGPIPVSETIFSAWIVMAVLLLFSLAATRNMKLVPTGVQNVAELIIELWLGIIQQVAGPKGRRFLPVVCTAFLFILFSNWIGTLPMFGNVRGFRSANSDLNVTASMAIIVFILFQAYGIKSAGILGYLKEFLIPNPLHILTELSRPLSLAFRLFGNIFAGEVLLHTILGIAPYALFLFLGLELFVGIVQALIFSMLTLVFLAIATAHERAAHEEEASASH